jgi:hypothetical protein
VATGKSRGREKRAGEGPHHHMVLRGWSFDGERQWSGGTATARGGDGGAALRARVCGGGSGCGVGEQALGSRGLNSGGCGTWACGPEVESCREGRRVCPGLEPEPSSRSGMTPTGGGHPPVRERGKGEGGAGGLGRGMWAARGGKKRRGCQTRGHGAVYIS